MTPAVYEAGVLVVADRNARDVWADHRIRLQAGTVPVGPAPVVTQVSHSPRRCSSAGSYADAKIITLTEQKAHAAGEPMGRASTQGVVDAVVAQTAAVLRADVVTDDRADIRRLIQAAAPGKIIDV